MNLFIQKKIEKCLDHFKQDVAKLEKYIYTFINYSKLF
jgi:hypothetical protein